jgi:hypothetical protein
MSICYFLLEGYLASFSVVRGSAACSDTDVIALARSFATTSPSILLTLYLPVKNAVYSALV